MRQRALTAINGAGALSIVLLMVQIWLLTSTLENFLAGHRETDAPSGADLRGFCFSPVWENTCWSTAWIARRRNNPMPFEPMLF